MSLKKLTEKDVQKLKTFKERVNSEKGFINFNTDEPSIESLIRIFNTTTHGNWVVVEKDEIIGLIYYERREPEYFKIHTVVVLNSQRGRGLAKSLIEKVENEASQKKVKKVKLSVEKGNEKVNEFYVKLGYVLKRTTKETYDFEKNLSENKKSYTSW